MAAQSPRSRYLFDTDILIGILRGHQSSLAVLDTLRPAGRFFASVVTEAELWSGASTRQVKVRRTIRTLLADFELIPMTSKVAQLAGHFRRDYSVNLPDAVIAATAVMLQAILLTQNRRHFERLPGVVFIDRLR